MVGVCIEFSRGTILKRKRRSGRSMFTAATQPNATTTQGVCLVGGLGIYTMLYTEKSSY